MSSPSIQDSAQADTPSILTGRSPVGCAHQSQTPESTKGKLQTGGHHSAVLTRSLCRQWLEAGMARS